MNKRIFGRWLWFTLLFLVSGSTWAAEDRAGGAPAYLVVSFPMFTFGLLWTMLSEGWVYRHYFGGPYWPQVWRAAGVNLASGLVMGIGLPFLVGFVFGIGVFFPGSGGELFSALGSWVFKDGEYRQLALLMTIPWMILGFWLTVRFEARFLGRQSEKTEESGDVDLQKVSLSANIVSYSGLLLVLLCLLL